MPDTTHTFPLTGSIDLHVRIGHGSVTVTAHDDLDTATVRLAADDADLLDATEVAMRGSTLLVTAPRRGGVFEHRSRHGLTVAVDVPSGTPVRIATASAPVVVIGRVGDAVVDVASGDTELEVVDGDLRLRSASGSARVAQVRGSAQVRSGSGDLDLGTVGGELDAGSGSGDLQVRLTGGRVHARCGSGTARLAEVHGDVDVVGGSGHVAIGLPDGVSAHLDVRTGSGRVHSDLPVDDVAAPGRETITVRARSGSGDVRLFRAA